MPAKTLDAEAQQQSDSGKAREDETAIQIGANAFAVIERPSQSQNQHWQQRRCWQHEPPSFCEAKGESNADYQDEEEHVADVTTPALRLQRHPLYIIRNFRRRPP